MSDPTTRPKRLRAFHPQPEALEGRVCLSWTTPPTSVNLNASGNEKITISAFGSDGTYNKTNQIERGQIDYRTFVAGRNGDYTFEAKAEGSSIDTVAALYTSGGSRLAYNDDAYSGTRNSRFTASLVAGRTYVLGITNYTGRSQGAYRVIIREPVLSVSAKANGGNDGYSEGSALLQGKTLTIELYGFTPKPLNVTDHYVQVKILDRNGRAIHSGYWQRGFRTAGTLIPGSPREDNDTWRIDLSGFDLRNADRLWINVGYS